MTLESRIGPVANEMPGLFERRALGESPRASSHKRLRRNELRRGDAGSGAAAFTCVCAPLAAAWCAVSAQDARKLAAGTDVAAHEDHECETTLGATIVFFSGDFSLDQGQLSAPLMARHSRLRPRSQAANFLRDCTHDCPT
jgi:hypothetical protein